MLTSQNGYPVPTTLAQQAALLTWVDVPGGRLRLRKGDVACVQQYVFDRLAELEVPLWPGCWSFYVRPIRGQTSGYSNHSSGSAFDFSAPKHPRQSGLRYYGWTPAHVAAVHRLLAKLDHVVRWGGDYVSRPFDPMHFEINASPAAVARVAAKIRAGQLPGQKGTTVTPIKTAYTRTQKLPSSGAMATLRVKDGSSNVSYLASDAACSLDGVIWVYGTGPAGGEVVLDGVFVEPKGKGWEVDKGIGKDRFTIGPSGQFQRLYVVRGDKPKGQRARIQAGGADGVRVTTVRVNVKKG